MNYPRIDNTAQRLNRLERDNLRLKQLAVLVLLGVAAILFMGQSKPQGSAKVVEAERFILRDESGKVRARLEVVKEKVGLDIHDEDGTIRASLTLIRDGAPSLNLYDKDGNRRATLGYTELEITRAVTTLKNTPTGMRTEYQILPTGTVKRAESSLVLFDKDRKVIWRAPFDPFCITCGYKLPESK